MRSARQWGVFLAVMCLFLRAGLGGDKAVNVFVSILPQAYVVEQLGGPHVEVDVLVGSGQSPHTFEPTPRQMAKLAEARVYFSVGVPFEARLLKKITATYKDLKVVDTRRGIALRVTEKGHEEGTGERGQHGHAAEEPDPHFWLNPRLAKIQAANICEGLTTADPEHAAYYKKNLKEFQRKLDELDAKIAKALAPLKGKEFMVFHPAFGYFGDRYGLKQVAVEIEGKEPSARQLAALIDEAKHKGVRVIFVQPQFSRKSAEAVARAIGGAVVPMDPLARDYMKNLEDMAEKVGNALTEGGS